MAQAMPALPSFQLELPRVSWAKTGACKRTGLKMHPAHSTIVTLKCQTHTNLNFLSSLPGMDSQVYPASPSPLPQGPGWWPLTPTVPPNIIVALKHYQSCKKPGDTDLANKEEDSSASLLPQPTLAPRMKG